MMAPLGPALLVVGSALVIFTLGALHLLFTFVGTRLHPREAAVRAAMEAAHPVLTRETTMWRTWIGFNASHSYGALLFGLVWGYLAVVRPEVLFGSAFLLGLGLVALLGYLWLGYRYWFSVPRHGILVATVFYSVAVGLVVFGG
ncbi:MAG: hypothetical protein IPK12_24635 [Gemmatimonadetes bacterium]|nr:hypothetical protein [Gemmatimonadota bacterium]